MGGRPPELLARAVEIHIPNDLSPETRATRDLEGWASEDLFASRRFGDRRWLAERSSAVLLVPSVVLQGREVNVLLNPEHPDFLRTHATVPEPVAWDPDSSLAPLKDPIAPHPPAQTPTPANSPLP